MEPGFSEHGPMVAEAMSTLGYDDDVPGWVDAYKVKRRPIPSPPQREPIDRDDTRSWETALGDYGRTADWLEFFHRELDEAPWQKTVADWVPRLLPGYAGGLTHGLIRTAHAVRAFPLESTPTALQLDELARGLASWAGSYQMVAGEPGVHGELSLDEAVRRLPRVSAAERRGPPNDLPGSTNRPLLLAELPEFATVVESLREPADAGQEISKITAIFARVLLAHSEIRPIPLIQLVHSITAPAAMRNLLPFFSHEFGVRACGYLWQTSLSLVARIAPSLSVGSETDPEIGVTQLTEDDLIRGAIEHRDEHAIKLTEACLREDRINPDPVYRATAEAIVQRLPAWR
jgi:hypothetical protein